ncbi:hypothetical protein EUX98_g7989 [Antrodiella citrinella]|uniref:RRM domain-containing protein n=1 Tax=Antrodiella citrinella TaxID=2447956 RepID=A0A4S4ME75_9APHY|nr:hypothetical protein EUX98_g7989 [Antrodiella citrinella]
MASDYGNVGEPARPQPHPYLHDPLLYISGLPHFVRDEDLANAFQQCAPFRPNISREDATKPVSGTIEFKYLEKAEKALATLQSRPIPGSNPSVVLVLSPYPSTTPPTPLPPPSASPRLVKHLPPGYTDSQLYDLFRPFGALASVRTQAPFGRDTGVVEFWREEDAQAAEESLHCADVEGQNIAVQIYQPRRAGSALNEFNVTAPTFVPTGTAYPYASYSPPRTSPYATPQRSPVFIHGPGQQVQLAPLVGPGSSSHSGLIDPCNLFIKVGQNLDLSIDSNALFAHFRTFGQIVSARVMRNEGGESRGFGFVSYQMPDQAAAAMHAMNGAVLGSKQLVVRLHEPKQLRQEKLAQRFSGHGNGHPRNGSGATSPTASEAGDYSGWSPTHRSAVLGSPIMSHAAVERSDRARRSSGSYYHAALQGTLNLPMRYDDLSALSPVVRKEVLSGELNRRLRTMESVATEDLDQVVETIVNLTLSDVVAAIQDPVKLNDQVKNVQVSLGISKASSPAKSPSPSPAASQDSRLDLTAPNATASAPDQPSSPLSMPATLSTPARTESPSGSVAPTSERDKMAAAVARLESSRQAELTELLMSLPKRERAMCLFNVEVLRAKIADAKMVLDVEDEPEPSPVATVPQTPIARKVSTTSYDASPKTPDLSSRGPSAAASPAPVTPSQPSAPAHTISSLAKLPATEIIKLINSSSATGLPLPKADLLVLKATDEFIDGLMDKPVLMQKQQLGDKLWRVVKAFGIRGAPKITITLLDQEDLRSLAHLMNSYPSVLKEKALIAQAAANSK